MGYDPPSVKDRVRVFANRLADRAAGRNTEDLDYKATEVEREHQYSRERQNEEAEPGYRQEVKRSRFLAEEEARAKAEQREATTRRVHEYEQSHPESYRGASVTRTESGIKQYVQRMQTPPNLRKKVAPPIADPAAPGNATDTDAKREAIRQRRLVAKTQAERERLDNIAKAQDANRRFQASRDAQLTAQSRRDNRRASNPPEPSWMDQLRTRASVAAADAARRARQAKGNVAAIHTPPIAERIKRRAAGIDLSSMLGSAVQTARGVGAPPLHIPSRGEIKGAAKRAAAKSSSTITAKENEIENVFATKLVPKAKARVVEAGRNAIGNIRETGKAVGTAYYLSQVPTGKKGKRVASLTAGSLEDLTGFKAKKGGRGGGFGEFGGGIGDIGGLFGGGGRGGGGGGIGDIGAMFGGGGGGGGRNYNAGTRNVYRPGAKLTCNSCGHSWTMRGTRRPRVCPHCKSYIWNKSGGGGGGGGEPSGFDMLDPFG